MNIFRCIYFAGVFTLQVHFLHEDVVVESVQKAVEGKLLSSDVSRTYYSQAFLPGAVLPVSLEREGGDEGRGRGGRQGGSGPARKKGGMEV